MYRTKIAYDPLARLRMAVVAARKNNTGLMKGIMAAIAASLAFTLMDVFVKALPNIASSELTFFRGVVGLVFIPLLCRQTHERFFTGEYWRLLALRGFFGSCGLFFFFLSIRGLTLGDSQILAQLSAFFMCLLSPFFLEERLPRQAIPGLLLITAGTLAVVQIWKFSSFTIHFGRLPTPPQVAPVCGLRYCGRLLFGGSLYRHQPISGKRDETRDGDRFLLSDIQYSDRCGADGKFCLAARG